MFEEEDPEDVLSFSLRNQLRLTELNLQSVGQQLRWANRKETNTQPDAADDQHTICAFTKTP